MYSITDRSSFNKLEKFYQQILRIKDVDHFPNIIIVGNKIDLEDEREVTKSEGEELAKKFGVKFFFFVIEIFILYFFFNKGFIFGMFCENENQH